MSILHQDGMGPETSQHFASTVVTEEKMHM